ncbi:ATP-dependent nuclease [Nocardiopsis deserti]|uniref:ATP-dependent nuclease n=1 Tax=Nocardiopsis deserti TaxID=2605988 RepID=UPI00168062CA|nr:AAA family ATPase [Nocardiopsis deserti]
MRIKSVRVENFRRLRSVKVDLDPNSTVFVGANNSGKTSMTHVFRFFFKRRKSDFTFYDFNSGCWDQFQGVTELTQDEAEKLPKIRLDLLLEVRREDWYRVVELMSFHDLSEDIGRVALRLEFAPREDLAERFMAARKKARQAKEQQTEEERRVFAPWPEDLRDYLDRELNSAYGFRYYVLGPDTFDREGAGCEGADVAGRMADSPAAAKEFVDSLIHVDMVDAQRFLSDDETSKGRDLSRHVRRFLDYSASDDIDHAAHQAVKASEKQAQSYLSDKFAETFARLNKVAGPGIRNPRLSVRSRQSGDSLLAESAWVYYQFAPGEEDTKRQLPERYNGLGYKNFLFMLIEIHEMHRRWASGVGIRPLIHLVVIEEPEAHMHPQLQQAFLKIVRQFVDEDESEVFHTQLMVTTHSPHIIYDTSFDPIRYFRRRTASDGAPVCEVRDLSKLQTVDSKFLRRFLKITNCHLFFADAVIIVEGDAERILLPLMIDKEPSRLSQLASSHISLLEVGGSHAHRFRPLVSFLGLPTLIIADIDSVGPVEGKKKDAAVPASTPNARSANSTLKTWLPRKVGIKELLDTPVGEKIGNHEGGVDPAKVRVAYQGRRVIEWNNQHHEAAGRTFEEAMILDNLAWLRDCGEKIGFQLGDDISAEQVEREVFEFVTRPPGGKTNLALTLFDLYDEKPWKTPYYIQEGLVWLNGELDREVEL